MESIPYLWINIIALLYFILMLIMFSFKNSKIYDSFAYLILSLTVWTWGSVFMRTFLYPGPKFWFRVSFGALMISPMFLYMFILDYFETTFNRKKLISVIVVDMLLTIPSFFGLWCDPPEAEILYGNTIGFFYKVNHMMIPPCLMILYLFYECYNVLKAQERKTEDYKDILVGTTIIIVANIINLVPENIFPFCMVGGMVGTFFFAHALYKKKLFKVNTNISQPAILLMAYITVCFLALPYINMRIDRGASIISSRKLIALWIAASLATLLVSIFFIWCSKKLYFNRGDKLTKETRDYAQTLLTLKGDRKGISKLLRETLEALYGDITIVLYTVERDNNYMDIFRSTVHQPMESRIYLNDRFAIWLKLRGKPAKTETVLSELGLLTAANKQTIRSYQLEYAVPLISNDTLIGMFLLGGSKVHNLSLRDQKSIASIANSTSIALRSSNMMEELKWELTQDHKTGLYNRKSYLEKLKERLKNPEPCTLIIYDIDDYKLFSQIYTSHEGEKIAPIFADALKTVLTPDMLSCRYSTKSFNIVINGDYEDGRNVDRAIREAFRKRIKGTIFSCLGFSGGMNTSRGNYSDPNVFITDTRQAVKKAKVTGKNHLEEFKPEMIGDPSLNETGFDLGTAEAIAAAIDMKDKYTFQHSNNVAVYARKLAKAAGLDPYDQQLIYEAGLIHDVGKIAIPDEILTKPGKLTDEEYEIIKSHVVKAETIIKASSHGQLLYPIVECHHERWDGKGYPYGKKGEEITLGGRCLAIADSFDAMTGRRVYKASLSLREAREELIRCRGTQFDPELTDVFVSLIDEGQIVPDAQ